MKIVVFNVAFVVGLTILSCSRESLGPIAEDYCPSDTVLLKPHLRVLDIGNSYTNDATACLPFLVEKLGVDVSDMCLYKATKGGASFKEWFRIYEGSSTGNFEVRKVIGGLKTAVEEGRFDASDSVAARALLKKYTWDVIIIHQLSTYATDYEEWKKLGNGGYLTELLDIIKVNQPNCTLGFLLIHSPAYNYPTNKEHSSIARWENISLATRRIVNEEKIDILIPYGTAIQNLRLTKFNNDMELTREGLHLGYGLAQYTAACCYYEALLANRTGVSILGKDIPYSVKSDPSTSQISVTTENMGLAQRSAVLACKYPFLCINPCEYFFN